MVKELHVVIRGKWVVAEAYYDHMGECSDYSMSLRPTSAKMFYGPARAKVIARLVGGSAIPYKSYLEELKEQEKGAK